MKNSEWPISPTFLSLREGCHEENAKFNTDGIYYTEYIQGFLADLSHDEDIQNAISIFQFVPEDFANFNATNKYRIPFNKKAILLNEPVEDKIHIILGGRKIIRIDSGTFINNGLLCDSYRKCKKENTEFCFKQDSIVGVFADKKLNNFVSDTEEYRKELMDIISNYNIGRDELSHIKLVELKDSKRIYIHYTCPNSLYEEHIFPIYVQGHIIACLMLGQMARNAFNIKKTFQNHREKMSIRNKPIDFETVEVTYVNDDNWKKKSNAIVKRIQEFEERLNEKIEHQNTRFINDEFEKVEIQFREDIKKIDIKGHDIFSAFYEALSKAFACIREKFDQSPDSFIRMFALPIDTGKNELIPIGWSGINSLKRHELFFNLKQLRTLDNSEESQQTEIIIKSASPLIKETFNYEDDVVLAGKLAGEEVAYIVWKRHGKELKKPRNAKTFETYKRALKIFYSVALECYSYIRGTKMELLLKTRILESAHESTHSILPALDFVENHLNILPKEMVLSAYVNEYYEYMDYFENTKEQVIELLERLREANTTPSIIFNPDLKANKTTVKIPSLLFELRKMLRNYASDSAKHINCPQKSDYIEADIDVKLFKQALYNLLDNAIKYGYDGSNININMSVDKEKLLLKIQIASYGMEITKDDKIYELFERGHNAEKQEGTGIGMYVVKKVCEAHGGTISHESHKISDYNIPVLFNYKRKNHLAKKIAPSEVEKLIAEVSRLSSSIEKEIVNSDNFIQYAGVFTSRIFNPTYKNSFLITIPLN